jgi:transcriptional antiterminator NusG
MHSRQLLWQQGWSEAMNMRHRTGEFEQARAIDIRPYAEFKQEKARRENRIRISQLGMASRRIADDYPELAAWLCFSVRARCEFAVEEALTSQNVHALIPRRKGEQIKRRHRIIPAPILPVLPGYVLVRCVPSNEAVQGVLRFDREKRVTGVLGNGVVFHRVSPKFINQFIEKAKSGAYDFRPPSPIYYALGEQAKIIDGPFVSFLGLVTSFDAAANRVVVEIEIFGRKTPIDLDVAQVEKV